MKFDRLRAPALAAAAVLTIAGAGSAMAASPKIVSPPVGAAASRAVEPAEAGDTDTIQAGDQTSPDGVGAGATSALSRRSAHAAATVKAAPKAAAKHAAAAAETPGAPETGAEPVGTETGPSDGPGGHADPAGDPNADHQFNGEE